MRQYQIALVVGSLRRESFNRKLATAVSQQHLRNSLAYLDVPTLGPTRSVHRGEREALRR
jgi:NAD(P)H-dependent FMN reductase